MHKRLRLALRFSTAALVFSGYLALASVQQFGLQILVIPILLIFLSPIGEFLDARYRWYREGFKAITIVYCAFIPFTWFAWGELNSVIALAMYIQANLMLHQKEPRFYHYIFLMAFFLLLGACVQSPEALIGLGMVAFLVSSVWAICCYRLHIDSMETGDDAGAEILPLRTAGLHMDEQRQSGFDASVAMNMALVSLVSVLLTVALFMFTPRLEAGLFGRNNTVPAVTGLSEEVDLRGGSLVQEDATVVMLVRFPEEPEGQLPEEHLYWRSTTFPRFANSKWVRSGLSRHLEPGIHELDFMSNIRGRGYGGGELQRNSRDGFDLVHQDIYLDVLGEQGIPTLDLVQAVGVKRELNNVRLGWDGDDDFTISLRSPGTNRLSYEAWSEVGDPDPDTLRADPCDYETMNPLDRNMLIYHELRPETQQLASELTQDEPTVYDKAVRIEEWLSGPDFLYTLDLPALEPEFAIDMFIHQTRRGHCELFASAMALMLRSLGIPTRVVNGYRGGEWSEGDTAYTVRQYMAHLWVEVYFPENGWVRFDPSPVNGDLARDLGNLRKMVSLYVLRSKMFWYQDVVGFSGGLRMASLRQLSWNGFVDTFTGSMSGGVGRGWGSRLWPLTALVGMLALLVIILIRRGSSATPRRALSRPLLTQDQVRVIRLYLKLRKKLARQGAELLGKTAEEVEEDLRAHHWVQIEPALELIHAYNNVRFGGRGLSSPQFTHLKRQLKGLRPQAT